MVRIERSDVLIGFLWLHWVAGTDRVMELHICVDHDQHGRWITRRLFRDFKSLVDFAGAKTILTRPSCDAHRDYLSRLGFLPVGIFSLLSVE